MRQWRTLVRERANREWRELSLDVVDELACHLADLQASAIAGGASDDEARQHRARRAQRGVVSRAVEAAARQARRRIRPRCPRRHPPADRDARCDGRCRAVARARHRREHRDFLARQQPAPARAARQGPAAARDPRRRLPAGRPIRWTYPIWQRTAAAAATLRQRVRVGRSSASTWPAAASRSSRTGSGRRRASSTRSASPPVLGRAFTDADDRRGGGQDGPVAVISYAFWQRRFGGAADAIGRRLRSSGRPVHDRRRHAAGLLRTGRRSRRSTSSSDRHGDVRGEESALDQRDWWWLSIMVRLGTGNRPTRPLQRCAAAAADAKRDAAAQTGRRRIVEQYLKARLTLVPAATGNSALRTRYERPLLTLHDRRRARAADRVREHREPAAGARDGAAPRMERAAGARRVTLASRAAADDRELRALASRRRPWVPGRALGQPAAGAAAVDADERRLSRSVARLARAGVHERHHRG